MWLPCSPGTGFSLEEFAWHRARAMPVVQLVSAYEAIIVFLCKPIDKSLEDLAAELRLGRFG